MNVCRMTIVNFGVAELGPIFESKRARYPCKWESKYPMYFFCKKKC